MTNFLKKLQNFIFQEKLLKQGDKVVVGVSGGPDSIGLSLAFKKLQTKYDLDLFLVHINYHQRGVESDGDQKFVEKFARENEVDLKVFDYPESAAKPDDSGRRKNNSEEVMRDFRCEKFEEVRQSLGFDKIAVAHNENDNVETFLMNLLRGSGLQGLRGIPVKNNFIIRPFLNFSKDEILKFLKENNQKFRIDKTNLEADFTRNKVRLKLIPFLEKNFNSNLKEGLGKLVGNLKDDNDFIQFATKKIYAELIEENLGEITCLPVGKVWDISKFKEVPIGGQKRIFREIIFELKGDLKNVTNNNFLEFKKILDSKKSKKQKMQIGKIVLIKEGNRVIFSKLRSKSIV